MELVRHEAYQPGMLFPNVLPYHQFLAVRPVGLGLPESRGFSPGPWCLEHGLQPPVAPEQVGIMNSHPMFSPRAGSTGASAEDPGDEGDVPELRGDAGEHSARPGHDPGPGGHAW